MFRGMDRDRIRARTTHRRGSSATPSNQANKQLADSATDSPLYDRLFYYLFARFEGVADDPRPWVVHALRAFIARPHAHLHLFQSIGVLNSSYTI